MQSEPTATADLHVHTTRSDGRDSPAEVVEWALRDPEIRVIAITDHDTIRGAQLAREHVQRLGANLDVVIGEEVSSRHGHILGLFLQETVPPELSVEATVAAIHSQGGLAVAAHPFWRVRPIGYAAHGVGVRILEAPFDAVEVLNGGITPSMMRANGRALLFNEELGLAAVGGSDAHVKQALGWAYTRYHGRSAADLRAAIVGRATMPEARRASFVGVSRYLAWHFGRPRPERPERAAAPISPQNTWRLSGGPD